MAAEFLTGFIYDVTGVYGNCLAVSITPGTSTRGRCVDCVAPRTQQHFPHLTANSRGDESHHRLDNKLFM